MSRHALRLLLTTATAAVAASALAAPAHAGLGSWTNLGGLTAAGGAEHVREYARASPPNVVQVFAATEGNGVFRSTNTGATWSAFNSGLQNIPGAMNVRTVFADGSRMLAGTGAGLFSSTAGGAWQPVAQGPEEDPKKPKKLNTSVQTLYSVTAGPLLAGGFSSGVYRSNDGGNTWIHPAPGNGMPAATTVWHMTSFVPGTVLAATSSGIFRSLDNGASWTPAGDGISGVTLRIYKDSQNPLVYYAGTTDGVYRTANGGITWSAINGSGATALGANTVRGMLIRGVGDQTRIYAATDKGLWVGTGTNENPLNPFDLGPVKWRHITDTGLGGHNIFWTLSDFNPVLGAFIAGTDGNGGYAMTLVPPVNTVDPFASGTLEVGQTIETTNGTWTGTPDITYTYQWQRCLTPVGNCTDIDNADQKTYTLASGDKNKWFRAVVTAENDVETFIATDEESNIVGGPTGVGGDPALLPGHLIKGNPTMSGDQKYSGDVLTAMAPTFLPAATFVYKWYRCEDGAPTDECAYIGQTNGAARTVTDADVNKRLRVKAIGTNSEGTAYSDFSNPSNIVRPKQATNLVAPSIAGAAVSGDALIVNVGKWEYPGTSYERQWIRCEANGSSCETLSGQKGAKYKLTTADVGKRLKVEVKADSNEAIYLPAAVFKMTPLSAVVAAPPVVPVETPVTNPPPQPQPQQPQQQVTPPPPVDKTAPVLATAALAKSSVKRGGSLQVAFRPTESGTLRIEVQSLTKGRKQGKACKAKAKKGKSCTIVKTVRTQVVATSAGAGSAKVALKGLKAGRYQVKLTPTDGAGNRGAAKTITFRIKKK